QEEHPRAVSAVEDGEGHQVHRRRHRAAPTAELHSSLAHDIGHVIRSHCLMQWKSWKVMPDETKTEVRGQLSTNYNLEDLDEESLANWKSDLHHHFEAFDDPQVPFKRVARKSLRGEDSWAWLCTHFQAPTFVNKAKVNKGNRKKKTLLHHSGSRPFSYKMDARRQGGSKFPEIDVFGDVYVRPGNELAESLHTTMVEMSQLVFRSPSQFPPDTRSSLWILTGCWVSNLDGEIVPFDNVIWAIPSIRSAGPDMDALTTVAMARIFVSQTAQLLIRSFIKYQIMLTLL
ncbi:hypothetical protein Prudu_008982, partial [Prunus dulcis]